MISLRRNLTRTLLATIFVLAGIGLIAVFLVARAAVIDEFDTALRAKAQAIETLTQIGPTGVTVGFTDRFFRGFDDKKPRDFFEIWDEAGRSVARSESLGQDHLSLRAGLRPEGVFWAQSLPRDRPGRGLGVSFVPRIPGGARRNTRPVFSLIVVSDRDHLDDNLEVLAILSAGFAAALLLVVLWLLPHVLRRGLAPLDELGEQAAAIDSKSLGTRFAVEDLPEELRPIALRLNDLLARIEQSFERERRFSADLAHELRTPLAELRSAAECAIKWPESREAAADRDTLAIAVQMEGMVGHMLALARSEQGQLEVKRERIDLPQLIRDRWVRLEGRARSRRLQVKLDLPPDLPRPEVSADVVLVRSIIDNLFENAVEYTPEGGQIEIALGREGLAVVNTVTGLNAEDVARFFERFWRKEASRSGGQHVGLGLALARAFAAAMGWTLEAQFLPPNQIKLTLNFWEV